VLTFDRNPLWITLLLVCLGALYLSLFLDVVEVYPMERSRLECSRPVESDPSCNRDHLYQRTDAN